MRYCSIHKIEYFSDCPECESDADYASAPHPSKHYERAADEYEPTQEELDEWYRSIAEPYGGAL